MAVDADDLATEFLVRNYQWMINGELVHPTTKDVEETLDRMRQDLYDEPVPSQALAGRLLMLKLGEDKYEVYLQIGQLP